jgi:uncharacterized protein YbjT (DUF2867 family)
VPPATGRSRRRQGAWTITLAIIGASGQAGSSLCRLLFRQGIPFLPVVRTLARWRSRGIPVAGRMADLEEPLGLARALAGAETIVCCAHARFAPQLLAAAPPHAKLVLMGSTRRFSRWPDAHGDGVRAGEAAFLASGRDGVMLHATMIYGALGEDNVQRLAALLRRLPVAPLPGGGTALVQPIHQDDVTRCLLAAIGRDWDGPNTLVIAGPRPLPYRDFLAAVARAAGQRPPPVLPVPAALLRALAPLLGAVPGLPRIRAEEIRRLTEDKAFDVGPMRRDLGVTGMELEDGLALTFGRTLAPSVAPPQVTAGPPRIARHADHQPDRRLPSRHDRMAAGLPRQS